MAQFDKVDETVIAADPETVFQAVIDEGTARSNWWIPTLEVVPGSGAGEPGTTFEIHILRPRHLQFSARVEERVEGELIRLRYTGGDFVGEGWWTFEPAPGGTRVRYRWKVHTHSLRTRLAALLIDIGEAHSQIVRDGFAGLRRYLEERATLPKAPSVEAQPSL